MSARRVMTRFVLVLAVLVFSALAGVSAASAQPFTAVASGLDNPRGLAFGPSGALYVAEAGRGGPGPCVVAGEGGEACLGATGAVTRISLSGPGAPAQRRVVSGLPSHAEPSGFGATGPHDITFAGPRIGFGELGSLKPALADALAPAYVIIGLGGTPSTRASFGPGGAAFGHIVRVHTSGGFFAPARGWSPVADLAAYEAAANPDGGPVDSNPYALVARHGGLYAVDAGGNDLLSVGPFGGIRTVAVFPPRLAPAPPFLGLPPGTEIPMESVPDAVTVGPDGAIYVGELTGFPFQAGGARVHRVVPGSAPTVYATGFSAIIDLAFGPDGSLYVLEFSAGGLLADGPGQLIRVAPNGERTTIASEGLVTPTGLAIDRDGTIYVSNFGVFPGAGQVVRIGSD